MERRPRTSTAVKQKWLDSNYVQFNTRIKPELYQKIRIYLEREGVSRAEFLQRALTALDK